MKKEFLDLGKQPLGNKFLSEEQFDTEFFYNLKVVFDEDTKLVSMKEFVKPEQIFDAEYPYWTSKSVPMIEHFKNTAVRSLKFHYNSGTGVRPALNNIITVRVLIIRN